MLDRRASFVLVSVIAAVSLLGCRSDVPASKAADYSQLAEPALRSKASQNDARAQRELAFRALREDRGAEAMEWLDKALALEPNSSDGYNIRGMAHVAQDRHADAELDFRRAAELAPAKAGPHLNLGRMHVKRKRYQAAAEAFQEALRIDPKNVDAAILAGDAWRLFGSSINGKRFYRKALELDPDEPRALAGVGIVLINTGQFEEAQKQLTRARDLGDATAYTRGYLGLAGALRARTPAQADAAIELLRSASAEGESGSHILYGLGLAYLAKGDLKTAEHELREGIRLFPEVSGLHHTLGDVYALMGRPGQSAAERERSASLVRVRVKEEALLQDIASNPRDVPTRMRYVDWLLSRREGDRAVAPLMEGLRQSPKDPKLFEALRRVAAMTRKPELLQAVGR